MSYHAAMVVNQEETQGKGAQRTKLRGNGWKAAGWFEGAEYWTL